MELKGFDSFDITLGDEMRGERASLGKSLEDAERELRIKARMITAIEDCDLSGFTNQSVVSGYVRSYARYLGLDPEDCFNRFCAESGYQSPAALMSSSGDGSGFGSLQRKPVTAPVGTEIGKSRFAAPPSHSRFRARISLGALTSTAALLSLIAGLGYGGYALLQDIQRVGFAPLPEAPTVIADAPVIEAPAPETAKVARPSAEDYRGGGALAAVTRTSDLPVLQQPRRDGPISAIDPAQAGIFARLREQATTPDNFVDPGITPLDAIAAASEEAKAREVAATNADPIPVANGITLHAADVAWVRIRDAAKATIWQGTLKPGEQFTLPERVDTAELRAGNAMNIYVFIDGVPYGPLGSSPNPINFSLAAENVRESVPQAAPPTAQAQAGGVEQRAEASPNR